MNFDQLSQAWREENKSASNSALRDQLIAKTCRRVERFGATIFNRDLRESIVAIVLMPIFAWMAFDPESALLEKIGAWVIVAGCGFTVYRMHSVRRSTPPAPFDAPLREYCDIELVRVEKQIMLLRTVLVWYVAPIMGGLTLMSFGRYGFAKPLLIDLACYAGLAWFLHTINQSALKNGLVPVREQLQRLRDGLDSEEDLPAEEPPEDISVEEARRLGIKIFLVCLAIGVGGFFFAWSEGQEYPKKSPFDAVRWRGEQPEVRLGEEWFRFESIDDVTLEQIIRFSKWTFGNPIWRKRFEEDLVEVLARMGQEPGETVRLVVTPLGSKKQRVFESAPMSEKKRGAIKRAAMTHGRVELPPKDS